MHIGAFILSAALLLAPLGSLQALEVDAGATGSVNGNIGSIELGTGAEVRTETMATTGEEAIDGTGAVDLEVQITSMQEEHQDIKKIDLSEEDAVTVRYAHKGPLFALFPVTLEATTKVELEEDGRVKVKTRLPWWSLFVTGTGSVSSRVEKKLIADEAALKAYLQADERTRAGLLEAIIQAHLEARVASEA